MHAPNWSTRVFTTVARRALAVTMIAAPLMLLGTGCRNDPVEVIYTYQDGGASLGGAGSLPRRGITTTHDSIAAFSRMANPEPDPGAPLPR